MARQASNPTRRCALGCVSFLNAAPLIDGLVDHPDLDVRFDVPSRLLEDLLAQEVRLALCPVVDYQVSPSELTIVPVGGIGCDGPTMTVRLFSRVPLGRIRTIHADTDSHTSVVLTRLVLKECYGIDPQVSQMRPAATRFGPDAPQALLMIGDKVVTGAPRDSEYPHQLDLGLAWKELTGLPFVFAVWMTRRGEDLGTVPAVLDDQRRRNEARIDQIVARHAARARFPVGLAQTYLGKLLRYAIAQRELDAMEEFWTRAHRHGLLPRLRPLELYGASAALSS